MNLQNSNKSKQEPDLPNGEEFDSTCSTPYVSAPSSPGRNPTNGYFFSAPASPMHFILSSSSSPSTPSTIFPSSEHSFEFEFSARFASNTTIPSGSMSSADELFLNGQIRPMKLLSHLQRPQVLAPLIDLEDNEEDQDPDPDPEDNNVKRVDSMVRGRDLKLRNRSMHRRTRSLSPLRRSPFPWHEENIENEVEGEIIQVDDEEEETHVTSSTEATPPVSASSSRSSSTGRNSKRWLFLKDFLRSKSEGSGGNVKEKFWNSIVFSEKKSGKDRANQLNPDRVKSNRVEAKKPGTGKPANGIAAKRRVPPSPHELHYTAKRAQAEEMRKKTFLPYRQGLFGCLGFSSKGYNAVNVFTRSLNPVSSR